MEFVGSSVLYNDENNLNQAVGLVLLGMDLGSRYGLSGAKVMIVQYGDVDGLVAFLGEMPTQEEANAWFAKENDL